MRHSHVIGIAAGALVAIGGVAVIDGVGTQADAAAVRVTASQLTINQRISQAAVRRSNAALAGISALGTQVAALTGGVPVPTILWGVSSGGAQESLVTTRGGNGVTSIYSNENGRYTVKLSRNIATCTYSATIAADNRSDLTKARDIRVALDLADAARTQLTVFTSKSDGTAARGPFHIQVIC